MTRRFVIGVTGKYIFIPSNTEQLNSEISEKEIKKYYKENTEEFINNPNREITYFVFNLTASNADKNQIMNEMRNLLLDKKIFNKRTNLEEIDLGFENTDNLESFINQYSDSKYKVITMSKSEFEESIESKNVQNNIIQPYLDKNLCKMGRIVNSTTDSIEVAYLTREIYASDQTLNEIYSQVYELINNNKQIEDLTTFAKDNNIQPRTVNLEKMDQAVPGLGSSRQIVRWAFNEETNLGEPTFFDLENKYIIGILSNVLEDEIKPLALVENDIRLILENKKKGDLIAEKINNLDYNSLSDIANVFKTQVKTIDGLNIDSDIFGSDGYNPEVVGLFLGSESGEISNPHISKKGVFIFQKLEQNTATNTNFNRYKKVIVNDYHSKVDELLVDALKENKKITDNRFNFY